ncbi:MAG: adenylate/guanylate cyclase domain-containing protein, partial [Flavobacteriales bacterium]
KGSTRIAEKLGHMKYSLFLQDCYRDFSIVDKFDAEIYQYVGDEVVISWPVKKVKKKRLVIESFFAFRDVLEKRRSHYENTYGLFPEFKAGAHEGLSIVTEVGEIKREITYHVDTLNTTARIQAKCNEFGAQLLISEALRGLLIPQNHFALEDVGCIVLRGKKQEVRLFKVEGNG